MCLLYYRTWKQLSGDLMVKVKVRISHVAINKAFYKTGDEFDCPPEKLAELGNAVTVVKDEPAIEPPGAKKGKSP